MLSDEQRLAILAWCLGSVLLLVVVMACKLSPFCVLYKYCPFKARYYDPDSDSDEKKKKSIILYGSQQPAIPGVKTAYMDYHHHHSDPDPDPEGGVSDSGFSSSKTQTGSNRLNFSRQTTTDSGVTIMDENQNVHLASYLNGDSTSQDNNNRPMIPTSLSFDPSLALMHCDPTLHCSLQYDQMSERISVYLSHIGGIAPALFGIPSDCCMKVIFMKDLRQRWRAKNDLPLDCMEQAEKYGYEVQEQSSKTVRRNCNPVFNEYFVLEGVKEKDKKFMGVKFLLYTWDRYTQPHLANFCQVNLSKVELISETKHFGLALKAHALELGELLLTLTYLPTSQRLNVNVIKATNLKMPENIKILNPYVKLTLLQKGRTMEKHAGRPQPNKTSPVFNEQFFFDLPGSELSKVVLMCSLYHKEMSATSPTGSGATSANGSGVASLSPPVVTLATKGLNLGSGGGSEPENNRRSDPTGDKQQQLSAKPRSRRSLSISSNGSEVAEFAKFGKLKNGASGGRTLNEDVCLGRVGFGTYCPSSGRGHFLEVITNPRKQVAQLHKLQF